ncbi:gluconate kinase, SKI family [Hymenobacter roseosalivarius DSM 11622]|uniref:Gluconokinase n=1 Tax=Hymenobacter roseosalivarius DSM 11622 TaxID=645990 RepID=A0A1W1W0L6_9BACT|nr:gluconokinase, GntK/IdnK-type [Hymenobacter roseosalivarius]SMB99182.1 gluconate kinase, SKI family [Hymenobacter roseosalivarius DSM 11622]
MICIVIGVSGSGKTTVGRELARALSLPFHDADDFHSAANVEKMRYGTPLTDEDRHDWLAALAAGLSAWEAAGGAVLACSALKEKYRAVLRAAVAHSLTWVVLEGDKELLVARLRARSGHYMKEQLLNSQLADYESPAYGLHLRIEATPETLVRQIMAHLEEGKEDNSAS